MKKLILPITVTLSILCLSTLSHAGFNGVADNTLPFYYYAVTGGIFPPGTAPFSSSPNDNTFRFITDDPNYGWPIQSWQKKYSNSQIAGLALTMKNNGTIVYDNNGLDTGNYGANYYSSLPGWTRFYSMSNNLDLIHASYVQLTVPITFNSITGYFDAGEPSFSPASSLIKRYRMNLWSGDLDDFGSYMPTMASFTGNVFSSDSTPGSFSFSDTGADRVLGPGSTADIYRLVFTLYEPVTLQPGEYFFSHDVQVVPIPGAVWLLGSGLLGLVGIRRRMKK